MYQHFLPWQGWIILHCVHQPCSASSFLSVDTCMVSTFRLLWTVLPGIRVYEYLFVFLILVHPHSVGLKSYSLKLPQNHVIHVQILYRSFQRPLFWDTLRVSMCVIPRCNKPKYSQLLVLLIVLGWGTLTNITKSVSKINLHPKGLKARFPIPSPINRRPGPSSHLCQSNQQNVTLKFISKSERRWPLVTS